MKARLGDIERGEAVAFEHVYPSARPVLAAVVTTALARRTWIVCENVSAQEALHNELAQWVPDALFYPEADVTPVEGVIADPENAAERLAVVQKLTDAAAQSAIVLTRASLDELVPT